MWFWNSAHTTQLGRIGPFGLWPYRIPTAARHTHLYVIGSTGSGKSKFLESLIVQDILAGRGVGLVDPHSDLARDTLMNLASRGFFDNERNLERVVYFEPTRDDYFLPFNVLKVDLPPYTIADGVIEAFRRTWPKSLEEAPRFTNIAQAALLALIEAGLSLVEMPRLLTHWDFREGVLNQITNADVVEFFHDRFDRWGRDTTLMIDSVLNKVNAFTLNPHLKRLLGAKENRLNFRRLMDEGKTLIVDLGKCDGETRRLIGSLVVTGIEQAALSRKDTETRRPFYLFLDEFQDFCANDGATKTLAQILSECRKFGLYLHLAHQTLGQLQHRLISALGNVGIKIAFMVDREDAEVMARKLFMVDTEAIKHESQTDTQHPIYSPLPEQWEQWVASVQNLPPRQAWVKRRTKSVACIRTLPIASRAITFEQASRLFRKLYSRHGLYTLVEASSSSQTLYLTLGSDWN